MKPQSDKPRKFRKLYLIILIVIAAVSTLLAVSLYFAFGRGQTPTSIAHSEMLYVILALLIVLPVLLVILIVAILTGRKKGESTEGVSDMVVKIDGATGETPEPQEEQQPQGSRFDGLTKIDEQKDSYKRNDYKDDITLKRLCETFRNFSANKLRLYYDISDIRRFIAGMAVSHILILQGMSGTGKTSLAYAFGEFLDNTSTVIPVQPMWKERTDLIGYYNEFTKRFNETDLLKKMYEANYSNDIYITVLDEMNIARVEYYFAEFLSLLELPDADKRNLSVVSDEWENDPEQLNNGHIKLPENMWFIGTANNDDSTFAISDKVYDRAMIMDLDKKAEPFSAPRIKRTHINYKRFNELVEEAQKEYTVTARNRQRLQKLDEYMIENFHITFGNRIMKQINTYIPVYVSCGGDELEALDDILAKKVMRKLSMQNPVYIRNSAEPFCRYMDELFGEENMPLCKAFVRRLEKNA
ncbi:MAG: AAA family ATPase [Clostridia bacterium]|nr:AAA family ATPase [Clostridia bacterium]